VTRPLRDADFVPLHCGPALVQRLLPQRPPFLMVDRLDAFAPGERPGARASRFLTANEPFFAGHFPALPLMPGALLLEGSGQTASLVFTMAAILDAYVEQGSDLATLVADLAKLDAAYSLRPGFRDPGTPLVMEAFARLRGFPVGMAGSTRLKFLRPVAPGCRLVYEVQLSHRLADQVRFELGATVDGEPVLEGTLSAAIVESLPFPGGGGTPP
jgi:3-hydroxyacyl-[acyl-carrier-protein] dehydratase